MVSYGGRGGEYDAERYPTITNPKKVLSGTIKRAGVTYRTYGEFADDYKPNLPSLKDHFVHFIHPGIRRSEILPGQSMEARS